MSAAQYEADIPTEDRSAPGIEAIERRAVEMEHRAGAHPPCQEHIRGVAEESRHVLRERQPDEGRSRDPQSLGELRKLLNVEPDVLRAQLAALVVSHRLGAVEEAHRPGAPIGLLKQLSHDLSAAVRRWERA